MATSQITVVPFSDPDFLIGNTVVTVDINHTSPSDLRISLLGPDGTQVVLSDRNGFFGTDYTNTMFNDRVVGRPITAGSAPFTAVFSPEELLSVFNGTRPEGVWTLVVEDLANIDSGFINGWSIAFEPVTLQNPGAERGRPPGHGHHPGRAGETTTVTVPPSVSADQQHRPADPEPGRVDQ